MTGASKLDQDKVDTIKDLLEMGTFTHQKIADLFGVSRELITAIKNGRRWNPDNWGFVMKEETETKPKETQLKPKTSNDFREFTPTRHIEVGVIQSENEGLDLEQKIYLRKFIESLTGKKIKKMIIEF